MTRRHVAAVLIVLGGAAAAAQESPFTQRTPNTLTAAAGTPSARATLDDIAWMAGRWTGTGLGGSCEEVWSTPAGGAMVGMFRLVRDGKPVFYEILTFREEEGSLVLKLKHFNPDLTGWEEKNDSVSFRLLKAAPDAVYFDGLTFKRKGADTLEIFLALRNRTDGTVREETFHMTREAR